MPWVEIYAVFIVSHLVGDYLIQTDWQAMHKRGGLRGTREMRRALFSHDVHADFRPCADLAVRQP
jgi:hypothetical protein